jgi:hypothetical protein
LLASSTDDAIRAECRRFLAYIYGGIGDGEKLTAVAEKCGNIIQCREAILAASLWGEERERAKQEYLETLIFSLMHTLFRTGDYWDLDTEAKKESYDIILRLFDFVFRGDYGYHNMSLASLHEFYADYLKETNPGEAVEVLSRAFTFAKMYDEKYADGTGDYPYSSPLANRLKHDREKCFPGSAVRLLLKQMTDEENNFGHCRFKSLREDGGYIALVEDIRVWTAKRGQSSPKNRS